MKKFPTLPLVAALFITALLAGPVLAEKPEWSGQGKNSKHEAKEKSKGKKDKDEGETEDVRLSTYFTYQQRVVIRDYYGKQHRTGRCPPGLAKKNNSCMPPGLAKSWALGQPLSHVVVYYPVPSAVVIQLGTPPAGYKYVRVASDILLIALGTSMIVDAVQDLGRL